MIRIEANNVRTCGINIPEPIFIRVSFTSRDGETASEGNVWAWINYKAFAVSEYEKKSAESPSFDLDGVENGIRLEVPNNYKYGWVDYNQLLVNYLISIGVPESKISIV